MFGRKLSPEAEQEKKEMDRVKRRLSRVEASMRMLDAQVNVLRRNQEEDDDLRD